MTKLLRTRLANYAISAVRGMTSLHTVQLRLRNFKITSMNGGGGFSLQPDLGIRQKSVTVVCCFHSRAREKFNTAIERVSILYRRIPLGFIENSTGR